MIKFRAVAFPEPSKGYEVPGDDQVVPDQSMSLAEMLARFVRGEELPVGFDTNFGDNDDMDNPLNVDLEKMSRADLVDKAAYVDKLKDVQRTYERQEKARLDAEQKVAADKKEAEIQKKIRIEARKLAKESSKGSA